MYHYLPLYSWSIVVITGWTKNEENKYEIVLKNEEKMF